MAYTYPISATVETTKNGNGGTVNLRATASKTGKVVEQIKSGTKIQVETLTGSWLPAKHGSKTGYIMAEFIAESDVYKGSSSGGESGDYKYTLIVEPNRNGSARNSGVALRDKASTSGKKLKTVAPGQKVYATKKDGEWLPVKHGSTTGYMMAKFLSGSSVYNARPAGATGTATYDRNKAVSYAQKYTSNDSGTGSYNNAQYKPVGDDDDNINKDCANYVSQCLFAGGIPMHDGWYYKDPGNVKNPDVNAAWRGTNYQERSLSARHFGERVYDTSLLKKGDLVYTYDSRDNGTYSHVVILSKDVGTSTSMIVCGHTQNQKNEPRDMKSKDLYFHIYDQIPTKSTDRFA